MEERYEAVVEKVIPNGNHGPYAVAKHEVLGLITFSLTQPVWKESHYPEGGSIVILSEINKKRAGWRANSGRFFKPFDEQPQTK